MVNQANETVTKVGPAKINALMLLLQLLSLMHPTMGELIPGNAESVDSSLELETYLPLRIRRQVINAMLVTMRIYSHCSISNQLSLEVLAKVKPQVDLIDLRTIWTFVLSEFRARRELTSRSVRRHPIFHDDGKSAQVNNLVTSLKTIMDGLKESPIWPRFIEITSDSDREFWNDICENEVKRLVKLMSCSLGEGHFADTDDDSDESESDNILGARRNRVMERSRSIQQPQQDDEEDLDHNAFMEQMMADMHAAQEDDETERL